MNSDTTRNGQAKPVASSEALPTSSPAASADPDMMTMPEAASHLRLSKSTLDRYRVIGGGPEYYKVGPRRVYYRRDDLDDWLERRKFGWTKDYRPNDSAPNKPVT